MVAEVAVGRADDGRGQRHPRLQAERAEDRHRQLGLPDRLAVVAVLGRQHRGGAVGAAGDLVIAVADGGQELGQPVAADRELAAEQPPPPQRRADVQAEVDRRRSRPPSASPGPGRRRRPPSARPSRPRPGRPAPARSRRRRAAKCSACRRRTAGPSRSSRELQRGEGGDGLEQREHVLLAAPGDDQPGRVDQRPGGGDGRRQVHVEDGLHVGDAERPGEHAEHRQPRLLLGRQQVVARLHHVGQPPAAVLGGLGVEQHRPLLQHLPDRERADPARDQLDRQRQAVEAAAELGDRVRRDVGRAEVGQPLARPGDEQLDRVRAGDVGRLRRRGRAAERRDGPADLARHAEQGPAGDHDPQLGHRVEQLAGQLGDLIGQPLGPVKQQQLARSGRQRALQRLDQRRALLVMDLEPGGEGRGERPRVPDLLERDEHDLGLGGGAAAERLGRQPALARAARADERDQPRLPQQGGQLGQLALAADETRPGGRQRAVAAGVVVGRRRRRSPRVRPAPPAIGPRSGFGRTPTG